MKHTLLSSILAIMFVPAFADITVTFVEGAPKDRFVIMSSAGCRLGPLQLSLDFSKSAGGLVFDVTETGAGVEVYQPLEFLAGQKLLDVIPTVTDGQNSLLLDLKSFAPKARIAFTIDVDDTKGGREITVEGSEISGSEVSLMTDGHSVTALFDETASATIPWTGCSS